MTNVSGMRLYLAMYFKASSTRTESENFLRSLGLLSVNNKLYFLRILLEATSVLLSVNEVIYIPAKTTSLQMGS